MDITTFSGQAHQERRFPRAMLKIKFWFNTTSRENRKTENSEASPTTKSRTEKILRSFKRTFRRTGGRFRDSKIFEEPPQLATAPTTPAYLEVPMSIPHTEEELPGSSISTPNLEETPPIPPPRQRPLVDEVVKPQQQGGRLVQEYNNLAKYGWYWGPLTKREAQKQLSTEPDGAFLVRDSSSQNHIYTLSLKSYGYTMHTYIEYINGMFKLGSLERASVPELISDALALSVDSILSYSVHDPPTPIRLLKPVSRNMEVRSLMHLCRFVVRQHCNVNAIEELPLPVTLKQYLLQGQY